jgi:uncharacterized protein YbjT (DUF2867 family)
MSRVVVVGGHGKIALRLLPLLSERGDEAIATIRSPAHAVEVAAAGGRPVPLDLEQAAPEDWDRVFAGADAVVFSAGAGGDGRVDRKRTVDFGASVKAIETCLRLGIHRFVQVSAIGVDEPLPADTSEVWVAYVEAKRDADVALRASGLAWTIIRPGALTDDEATGSIALAAHVTRGEVPRADVAAVIAASLGDDGTVGQQWELVSGGTPIAEAIEAASATHSI